MVQRKVIFIIGVLISILIQSPVNAQLFSINDNSIKESLAKTDFNQSIYRGLYVHYKYESEFLPMVYLSRAANKKYFNFKTREFKYPEELRIDSCYFLLDSTISISDYEDIKFHCTKLWLFNSVFTAPVGVQNITFHKPEDLIRDDSLDWGLLWFDHDSLVSLSFTTTNNVRCDFSNSYLEKGLIEVANSTIALNVSHLQTSNKSLQISSKNSNMGLNVMGDFEYVAFVSDKDSVRYGEYYGNARSLSCKYSESVIKAEMKFFCDSVQNSFLQFSDCKFLKTTLWLDEVDTLVLENCTLEEEIYLNLFSERQSPFYLSLYDTDWSKINFDFTPNIHLFFDDGANDDEISATYQKLMEKFKNEGKSTSYKNVDIQYRKHRYERKGVIGTLWSKVDEWWWNFGYNKNKILSHTFLFLGVFFLINLFIGKKLMKFYPILLFQEREEEKTSFLKYATYCFRVLVTTIFIFFTFKLDFSRIDANKTKMLMYLLLHYFVGLICLFFLFNAVLKL